jgi:DNA-binding transcriptional regulator YiaG
MTTIIGSIASAWASKRQAEAEEACQRHFMDAASRIERKPMTPDMLTEWRKTHGFSKSAAARRLGCSRKVILDWEEGRTRIPVYIDLAMQAIDAGLVPRET